MFETIQNYEKEVNLYKTILKSVIDAKELQKLEQKCAYDTDNKKWKVPLFTIGHKQVSFPKLKLNHGIGYGTTSVDKKRAIIPEFKIRSKE